MTDFWEKDKSYILWRKYIDWSTRRSFRKIETVGTIPPMDSGAWFVVSNHTHTLMDAMLILQSRPGKATSFGARADVFRIPIVARFLHFCKILPLARKGREKPEEVAHNRTVMEQIDQVVAHGVPFCLFPEGRHRPMHSLLPLRRGIASMAFRSASQRQTYILPLGLEYDTWYHYRGSARLVVGERLDVNAFMSGLDPALDDSARDAALLDELFKRISSLILYIPDDEHYQERLDEIEASKPRKSRFWSILTAVLTFPAFLIAAVLSLPLWLTSELICRFVIKDKAFSNSVRYMVRLFAGPLVALIVAILALCFLPWWGAIILVLLFIPSYSLFYEWLNLVRN